MAALIGLLVGLVLWWQIGGSWGLAVGGVLGVAAGALVTGQRQRGKFRKPAPVASQDPYADRIEARVVALEHRLLEIERLLHVHGQAQVAAPAALPAAAPQVEPTPASDAAPRNAAADEAVA